MNQPIQTVVGIDVGGKLKGFHAVALRDGNFVERKENRDPGMIVAWCLEQKAEVVAVDAPCQWSQTGSSRLVERELAKQRIYCYATPTRKTALLNRKGFYDWVFNGEALYRQLQTAYQLFNGKNRKGPVVFETFPHAIVCSLAGRVASARPKATVRRQALRSRDYDDSGIPNIDYIDAALCAVAADEFLKGNYKLYGNQAEGFIVVPAYSLLK